MADFQLRRKIGNALGLVPSPDYIFAYLDDNGTGRVYPAWEISLSLAIEDLLKGQFSIEIVPTGIKYAVYISHAQTEKTTCVYDTSLSLAVCLAWLEYKDGKGY